MGIPLRSPILLAVIAIVAVGAVAAAAVIIILAVGGKAHPPDETAKFFPRDTQIYFSLNLSPGNDQLRVFRDIVARFRENPEFQRKIDDAFDEADAETGIDLEKEVLPWLGPEIGIGLVDVVGSAIGVGTGGTPLVLALIGTKDPEKAKTVLQDWMHFVEQEMGISFETDSYKGVTVHGDDTVHQHYAVTKEYVLFATDRDLLDEAIDRMEDGETAGTLYGATRFQEARNELPDPRFSTLYVDARSIWLDARRQLGEELPIPVRDQLNDEIPEWLALAGSFIDKGVKLTGLAASPDDGVDEAPMVNSLRSTRLLPSDTFAFASFVFEPDLDPLRKTLESQSIDDLGPDFHDALSLQFGLAIDRDGAFSDVLDAALVRFEEEFGLDLERDVLGWMTGEFSLALLPTDFEALSQDPAAEPLEALALVQFDPERLDDLIRAVDRAVQLLEEKLGLLPDRNSYGGGQGATFDIQELVGPTAYQPGYLILDDHLLIATTGDALKLAGATSQGQEDSLPEESRYARGVEELSKATDQLVYVNIGRIRDSVVEALAPDDLQEYRKEVEPFIGPLAALLLGGVTLEGLSRVTITLTIK